MTVGIRSFETTPASLRIRDCQVLLLITTLLYLLLIIIILGFFSFWRFVHFRTLCTTQQCCFAILESCCVLTACNKKVIQCVVSCVAPVKPQVTDIPPVFSSPYGESLLSLAGDSIRDQAQQRVQLKGIPDLDQTQIKKRR